MAKIIYEGTNWLYNGWKKTEVMNWESNVSNLWFNVYEGNYAIIVTEKSNHGNNRVLFPVCKFNIETNDEKD